MTNFFHMLNTCHCSMPPIIYMDDGDMISKQVWDETMDELSFANVTEIIQDTRK